MCSTNFLYNPVKTTKKSYKSYMTDVYKVINKLIFALLTVANANYSFICSSWKSLLSFPMRCIIYNFCMILVWLLRNTNHLWPCKIRLPRNFFSQSMTALIEIFGISSLVRNLVFDCLYGLCTTTKNHTNHIWPNMIIGNRI